MNNEKFAVSTTDGLEEKKKLSKNCFSFTLTRKNKRIFSRFL